jgi:hypothetical protein
VPLTLTPVEEKGQPICTKQDDTDSEHDRFDETKSLRFMLPMRDIPGATVRNGG